MDKQYKAKGILNFVMTGDENSCGYGMWIKSIDDIIQEATKYHNDKKFKEIVTEDINERYTFTDYGIMSGLEFLENVLSDGIMNYDGHIAEVFVDGYKSNLGLFANGFYDGEFLVDEYTFREICKEHTVEVNWANK